MKRTETDAARLLLALLNLGVHDPTMQRAMPGSDYFGQPNQRARRLILGDLDYPYPGASLPPAERVAPPEAWDRPPAVLIAAFDILSCYVDGKPPAGSMLRFILTALNEYPVRKSSPFLTSTAFKTSAKRHIAEALIRYVRFSESDEKTRANAIIGHCHPCRALFLKRKSNQEFCSDECQAKAWNARNPAYRRERMKAQRARKTEKKRLEAFRLSAARMSPEKIAARLKTKPHIVKGWIAD